MLPNGDRVRLRVQVRHRVDWSALLSFGLPLGIALVGWFLFNAWRFGGVAATGYEDQPEGVKFATPLLVGLHGFLCSPGKGLFFFSPPLLLAVTGVGLLVRRGGWAWGAAWGLSGGLFFLAMCKWQNWAGGWCWGPRHIFQNHAWLMLALAPLLAPPRRSWVKVAAMVTLVAGLAVQILGSSVAVMEYYRTFFAFTATEPPSAYVLYSPEEVAAIDRDFQILYRSEEGTRPIPAAYLPAPINDSIYVPQNTQWYAYPVMLRDGRHDFLWLRLLE